MPYVLDTNVLVSAVLGDGSARRLLLVLAQRGDLVTSRSILDEFLAVAAGAPQLKRRVTPLMSARLAAFVERNARIVEPAPVAWKENPADAAILGTGLAGKAVVVTGDRRVLAGAARFGVEACTITEALARLGA